MDREQVAELIVETEPAIDAEAAKLLVEELEGRGLLVLGERRRWRVVIDDPGAVQRYEFDDVEACTARAASVEAARRVIRLDPGATMPQNIGKLSDEQRAQLADGPSTDGLVWAVTQWAVAEELGPCPA